MANKNKTLGEFIIENQEEFKYSSGELSRLINSIRLAAKVVNHEVNKAGLVDILVTKQTGSCWLHCIWNLNHDCLYNGTRS